MNEELIKDIENTESVNPDTTGEQEPANNDIKTFNQAEVDKIIAARLERERIKFKEQLETEKQEAEKMAALSESERLQAQIDAEKKELADQKKEFEKMKNEQTIKSKLIEMEAPSDLSKFIDAESMETAETQLKELMEIIGQHVEKQFNKKIVGNTPKSTGAAVSVTKADFEKMTYSERMKIYNSNPELYNQLIK